MTPTPNGDALERARENPAAVADWLVTVEGAAFLQTRTQPFGQDNLTTFEIDVLTHDWFVHESNHPVFSSHRHLMHPELSKAQIPQLLIDKLHSLPEAPDSTTKRSLLWAIMCKIPRQLSTRNDRDDALFPQVLVSKTENDRRGLFSARAWHRTRRLGQLEFPSFDTGGEEGIVRQCLPVELYELPHRSRGNGAPLARRIFVNAVLDVPQNEWQSVEPVNLPAMSLRRFLANLYPKSEKTGRINWRANRHLDDMLEAIDLLGSHQARITWEDPETGFQTGRQVVQAVDFPSDGHLDGAVRFRVDLPPGTGQRGIIFDRLALVRAGARSAPAFDLATSLACMWYVPGRTRIPVGSTYFQVNKAVKRYPEVSNAMLWGMAYPAGDYPTDKNRTAQKALSFLAEIGYAEVVDVDGTRRIKPGRNWAGWPE